MTMTASRDITTIERIGHDEAMRLAAAENAKFGALLRNIAPEDWSKPTDCDLWDVRATAAHVVGSAAGQVSPREFLRQKRKGKPVTAEIGGQFWWDGMNEVQVRERASLTTDELIAEWESTWPKAVKARTKLPRPIANLKVLNLPVVGKQPLRYLFDVGFTRDVWMHRVDMCRAIGYGLDFDAEHDGRLMEDYVAEWASVYDIPFTLNLTGPAGGTFTNGNGGEVVTIDAVELLRTLAEREHGEGMLANPLPL
ncbi:MAG TPA: maleylpyruvate isomerase family mycothiol-dependent enzyme [Acidimicrobiales bacterium]|nr:maleylpyruvate isomerase family mycothiol-dependent enzyme [Acidimicrobiales bacterium]